MLGKAHVATTLAIFLVCLSGFGVPAAMATEKGTEQRGLDLIAQLSKAPSDDYGEFIQANFHQNLIQRRGAEDLARILTMLSTNHSDMEVHAIEATAKGLSFTVKDAAGGWLRFDLQFGPEPLHLIEGLGVGRTNPPRDPDAPNLSQVEWIGAFAEFVETRAAADRFSGAVMLAHQGKPVYAKAFGFADKEKRIPNTLATPINLGSMNKMFTGLAVAQLVAQDKLSYDDTVGTYLPDYPNVAVRDKVTLHHLLTHTSGLDSYWNDRYLARKKEIRTTQNFAKLFQDDELLFTPGDQFHYSNNGPVVLGLIIEAVTGKDYYQYIRDSIYRPANMIHSDHYEIDDPKAGIATGYYRQEPEADWQPNTASMGLKGSPGGGGYASVNDLLRFSVALMDHRLLPEDALDTLITGKVSMGPDAEYAYGFGDHYLNKHRYVGHNGGAPGINADFSIFTDLGYTVAVLSNYGRAATPVADKARELIAHNN